MSMYEIGRLRNKYILISLLYNTELNEKKKKKD